MFFSIIVPVYKAEKYLNRCVDSILKQSFRDFELILVDDGSPDRCGEICDRYAADDERVAVIHQKNQGPAAARNVGLEKMGGNYVLFVDSDDWVEPNWLEEIRRELAGQQVDVVVYGYTATWQNRTKEQLPNSQGSLKEIQARCFCNEWGGVLWNRCWRQNLFCGLRFPTEPITSTTEDMWITPKLMFKAKSVAFIEKCLYNYWKDDPGSITATIDSAKEYRLIVALTHNKQLLLHAGLASLKFLGMINSKILIHSITALLANEQDNLLTEQQVAELNTVITYLTDTIEAMDIYNKYKTYKSMAGWAYRRRLFSRAVAYICKYTINKVKYLLSS